MIKISKELIESYRKIVIPFVANQLYNINFEGQGALDRAEFEQDCNEILDLAISALHPTGDLISREYVESIIKAEFVDLQDGTEEWRSYVNDTCENILIKVHNAPTVETYTKDDMTREYLKGYNACKDMNERPTGEWIPCTKSGMPLTEQGRLSGEKWYGFKCSNPKCNYIYKGNALTESPFCQKCGADMKGGAE